MAGSDDLRDDAQDGVRGHCKADSGAGAALAIDGGVHAQKTSSGIEQRPSRVAGIDGRVGLNHVPNGHAPDAVHRAPERTHDADGQSLIQPEGVTDGDGLLSNLDQFTHLWLVDRMKLFFWGLDLQDRNVFAWLYPNYFGVVRGVILQSDGQA